MEERKTNNVAIAMMAFLTVYGLIDLVIKACSSQIQSINVIAVAVGLIVSIWIFLTTK